MPVWHDATRKLRDEGRIQLVGLIQEQHPDRCKLFMQWKQMDWPVLVDPLNLLEVSAVPLALLIDLAKSNGIALPVDGNQTRFGSRFIYFDPSKAWSAFGPPQIAMRQSVADTYRWYVEHGYIR